MTHCLECGQECEITSECVHCVPHRDLARKIAKIDLRLQIIEGERRLQLLQQWEKLPPPRPPEEMDIVHKLIGPNVPITDVCTEVACEEGPTKEFAAAKTRLTKTLNCLYIAVPKDIADDVGDAVRSYIIALDNLTNAKRG